MPSTSSKPSKASKPTSKASKSNSDSQPASQTTNQPTNLPCLTRASASVAMNLLANYPLLQTTTPRAAHTGREDEEDEGILKESLKSPKIEYGVV